MSAVVSLVVDFQDPSSDQYLSAELDTDRNQGKSSFMFGDSIYFNVWADPSDYNIYKTAGSITNVRYSESRDIKNEIITMANTKEASLSKSAYSGFSYDVLGGNISNLTVASDFGKTKVIGQSSDEIPVGVFKVNYTTKFDTWKLNTPSSGSYPYAIVIVIIGTA